MKFDVTARIDLHVHSHGEGPGLEKVLHMLGVIHAQGEKLMSAVSDFADKMKVHNDAVDVAVDGLTADIASLKQMITDLQNNPGPISPADQALLDALEVKAQAVSDKLAALDALTPPAATP